MDTNVARVIRRAFLSPRAITEKRVWAFARALVPRRGRAAWTFNQAIMELGVLVCTARVARRGEMSRPVGVSAGQENSSGER